jgi:hypothetical protein
VSPVKSRGLITAAVALMALLVTASAATAKPASNRIDPGKGVGGVNLNLRRGPIVVHKGKHVRTVHTVNSMLGKPQSVHALPRIGETEAEKQIYLANYTDDKLSVYYSERDAKGKLDNKRDANDRVLGVVTYTSKYFGRPQPGQAFSDDEADGPCAPLDAHVAPDGGPRRAAACKFDPPGDKALDIVYLSGGTPSRSGQFITQLAIFQRLPGFVIFSSLLQGALEDLNCENVQCT